MPLLGVTLTANGVQRLEARPPQLALADVEGARELEPGRPLRLIDERGATRAIGVADPENELLRIWSETRKTVLFVTHSLNEAVYLADRVIVLTARPGRIADDVAVDLPRPRTFTMTGGERFGALKDRIWQHIKHAERP